ncbi:nitrilase-related carbon-nitrogen hydrolase, partial [Catellatospora chokoriensis]|uniref:nitrilase-related carbon-nitrogen hydrolase n=1 Tax=Catellatospora chokoriensis TaxID=310353 RepID=UPI0031455F18
MLAYPARRDTPAHFAWLPGVPAQQARRRCRMSRVVRAALVQTTWTGDKESMIKAHEEYARQAAAQGAKVICFQELF